jgi:hypothetical protein
MEKPMIVKTTATNCSLSGMRNTINTVRTTSASWMSATMAIAPADSPPIC